MIWLAERLWPWMAAAAVLGLAVGWISRREARAPRAPLVVGGLLVYAAGVAAAAARALPGRMGLFLEVALLLAAPYALGLALGRRLGRAAAAADPAGLGEAVAGAVPGLASGSDALRAATQEAPFAQAPDSQGAAHEEPAHEESERDAPAPDELAPETRAADDETSAKSHDADTEGAAEDREESAKPRPSAQREPASRQSAGEDRSEDETERAAAEKLVLVRGVGPGLAAMLAEYGVRGLEDLAEWTQDDADWHSRLVGHPGRAEKEAWIGQAKLLGAGVETPHALALRMGRIAPAALSDEPLSDDEAAALSGEVRALAAGAGVDLTPRAAPPPPSGPVGEESRPPLLSGPPSAADDLKLIWGVGPKIEATLNAMGVYRFDQIAQWSEDNLRWVDANLTSFKGRGARDRWILQCRRLATGWRPRNARGERV